MALEEPKTIELGDVASGHGLLIDIHPQREMLNLRIGKENIQVSKAEFWGACFTMADAKTQDKLMPVRQTEMMTFEKIHRVKVKKALNAGDVLKFRCKVDVPVTVAEGLKGMVKDDKKSIFTL